MHNDSHGADAKLLLSCCFQLAGVMPAEITRGQAEFLAEQPAETAQAFKADVETDGSDRALAARQEPAGGPESSRLQKLHGRNAERLPEHALEMIGRQTGDLGDRRDGQRLVEAGIDIVAGPV